MINQLYRAGWNLGLRGMRIVASEVAPQYTFIVGDRSLTASSEQVRTLWGRWYYDGLRSLLAWLAGSKA